MTNQTIIYNAACELMKQGIIKATGRLLMKKLTDGSLIEVPEPETIHTYNGWKALGYQVRKGEQKEVAYINHPLTMVCQALSMHIYDDDILCALLLHDVVEDTNTTLEELPVNDETRELVRLMTKDPHPKDKAAAKNVYYAELKKNPKAALVKCFDRVNNLSNMALGFTRDKMVEYVEETEKYIVPLLRVIKDEAPEYADPCWLLSYQMFSLLETYKRLL